MRLAGTEGLIFPDGTAQQSAARGELAYAENVTGNSTAVTGSLTYAQIPGTGIVVPATSGPVMLEWEGFVIVTTPGAGNAYLALMEVPAGGGNPTLVRSAAREVLSLNTGQGSSNPGTIRGSCHLSSVASPRTFMLAGANYLDAAGSPAVPATVTSVLSADVAMAAATVVTILSITLPVGTWEVNSQAEIMTTSGAGNTDTRLVFGTAAGTFAGPQAGYGRSTAANSPPVPATGGQIVTVTTAGTVLLQGIASVAATAKAVTAGASYAGITAMSAVKLLDGPSNLATQFSNSTYNPTYLRAVAG